MWEEYNDILTNPSSDVDDMKWLDIEYEFNDLLNFRQIIMSQLRWKISN